MMLYNVEVFSPNKPAANIKLMHALFGFFVCEYPIYVTGKCDIVQQTPRDKYSLNYEYPFILW